MKKILKNIGIITFGIIIGMIINMGLIILGGMIIPPADNFEPMNAVNWDLKYFIFPFLIKLYSPDTWYAITGILNLSFTLLIISR